MKKFKRLSVLLMIVASMFMTGCDASKILEMVGKVAQGIQQAIPAVKGVIDQVANGTAAINTNTVASGTGNIFTDLINGANTTINTAGDQEDLNNTTTAAANTTGAVGALPALARPNGRAEIERVFGARGQNQVTVSMDCGPNGSTKSITCHRLIADRLKAVFAEIKARGLSNLIHTYDGCFVDRNKRGGTNPSTHAWGIGIDINAGENPMGSSNMTAGQRQLAEVFKKYGFYQLPNDPMHFQYCTGY